MSILTDIRKPQKNSLYTKKYRLKTTVLSFGKPEIVFLKTFEIRCFAQYVQKNMRKTVQKAD